MNLPPFLQTAWNRFKQDVNGARILADWMGSGGNPVPQSVANARAKTCVECQGRHNRLNHRRLEPAIAEAIREQESARLGIKLVTPYDPRLHTCQDNATWKGCGCYLKLKVWVPIENQGDTVMPPYCWVTQERGATPDTKKTISVRRMDAFGDVIMATVLADKLKAAGHNVDFYVSSAVEPILKGHPSLRAIPNDRKTPVNIELDNTYETNQERRTKSVPRLFIEAAAHQLRNIGLQGVSTTNLYPSFPIGSDERQTMLERGKAIPRPWVAMNHRSQSWPSRSVSVESLTEAARQIKGSVIWTHPGPVPKGCHSIRTGSFRELMALLSVCDLLVTPDSGPMHAASAVGCPVIALEQSQPIALRMPPQCDHRVLSAPVDCVRCLEWKCPKDEIRPPCQTFNHAVIAGAVNARLAGTGKVSVVIPVYKNHPRLKRCVNAIPAGTEIVVALDGDAETPVLPVTVVPSPGSRTGFGRTCTRGAREANGEFLLFLNDDCYLNPGAIPAMLKEMRPDVAVVGCLLRYPDGRIQHGGTTRSGDKGGFGHIDHTRTVPSITTPREMEFVTFAAALVRRKAFFQVHGFDEDYDTYCEDSDLCLRLRAKGWKIIYTPHASGVHDESQTTSPMKTELWNKSSVVFWNRWKHLFQP